MIIDVKFYDYLVGKYYNIKTKYSTLKRYCQYLNESNHKYGTDELTIVIKYRPERFYSIHKNLLDLNILKFIKIISRDDDKFYQYYINIDKLNKYDKKIETKLKYHRIILFDINKKKRIPSYKQKHYRTYTAHLYNYRKKVNNNGNT